MLGGKNKKICKEKFTKVCKNNMIYLGDDDLYE